MANTRRPTATMARRAVEPILEELSTTRRKDKMMKPSTQDRTEGKLHEVKGKIKEEVGKATTTPIWKSQGKRKRKLAKFKNGSAVLKRLSENKDVSTLVRKIHRRGPCHKP